MSQTTTIMKKKYPSNDQAKLKIVCDEICDQIESVLDHFDLEYNSNGKMIIMACPIHGGDNQSALNIYPDGEVYRGNWKCRTHGCEKHFKGSVIGFIRGVISHAKYGWIKPGDNQCSFQEALAFCLSFINKDLSKIRISHTERNKKSFIGAIKHISVSQKTPEDTSRVTRAKIRQSLIIPAEYYIDRGYSPAILDKYDVGLCDKPNKEMSDRIVVPIYDHKYQYMVGCSGRSIFDKCESCSYYHNPADTCPKAENHRFYSKWKHNFSFQSQNHLYNIWFAKQEILDSGIVILVESPGNVWRLAEAGVNNSVAIFGSSLSDRQKMILDASGAMTIITMMDNDPAGHKATEQIKQKCHKTYNVKNIEIPADDVAELTVDYIRNNIIPLIQ